MKDVMLLAGFALIVTGTAMISIPVAMIVAGAILMVVGIAGHFYSMRPPK